MENVDGEEWRTIPGFENYSVSNMGRVRRDVGGRGTRAGKILRPVHDRKGYFMVHLCHDSKPRKIYIHRLVLLAFRGQCPPGKEACHEDGDPTNNRLSNLRYDTSGANHLDMHRHGKRIGAQKLTPEQALEIIDRLDVGETCAGLGRAYGVSTRLIWAIKHGHAWTHLRTRSMEAA